jgi:acetyl-CoA acyltransferase
VAENHARESSISREAQDEFSLRSHQRAVAAIDNGYFKNEIVPLTVRVAQPNGGKPSVKEFSFDTDEGPRKDTSIEALAKLKPAFLVNGSVTAGNRKPATAQRRRSSRLRSWPRSAASRRSPASSVTPLPA